MKASECIRHRRSVRSYGGAPLESEKESVLEFANSIENPYGIPVRFKLLDASGLDRGPGGIVCMCESPYPLTETDSLIPSNIL